MYKSFIKDNAIGLIAKDQHKDCFYYKKLYYTLTMNNIKRNNNILFEGCDAHGLFYSCDYQLIIPYDKVVIPNTYDEEIQLYPELTLDEELQMFSEIKLNDEIVLFTKSKLDNENHLFTKSKLDDKSVLSPELQLDDNQLIPKSTIDNKIIFDKYDNILNIEFIRENGYIKILKSGVYIINLSCQFNEEGEIIICINNIPDMLSLTKTITPYNFITIHYVLNLKCDDIVSFHNYSSYPLTTYVINNNEIDNVCLHIWMISKQLV
jgi:hypothetical protein